MATLFSQPTSVFSQLRLFDFMSCTLKVNTDWAKVETSDDNVYFMQAPCSGEAQTYSGGVQFTQKSVQVGILDLKSYSTKKIPFLIASNGSPFEIKVTHGAHSNNRQEGQGHGNVEIRLPYKTLPSSNNPLKGGNDHEVVAHFQIHPLVVTTAKLTINPDCQWGAIKIHNGHASIHTIASSEKHTYDKVTFSSDKTYMKVDQKSTSGKKAEVTIPFILVARHDEVDITITHGCERGKPGTVTAHIEGNVYGSASGESSQAVWFNPKSFKGCKVGSRS